MEATITSRGPSGLLPANPKSHCNSNNPANMIIFLRPLGVKIISFQLSQFPMSRPDSKKAHLFIPVSTNIIGKTTQKDHNTPRYRKVVITKKEASKISHP